MAAGQDLREISDKPVPGVDELIPGHGSLGRHLRR